MNRKGMLKVEPRQPQVSKGGALTVVHSLGDGKGKSACPRQQFVAYCIHLLILRLTSVIDGENP